MNDPKNKLGQYAGLEQLSTQALEDLSSRISPRERTTPIQTWSWQSWR